MLAGRAVDGRLSFLEVVGLKERDVESGFRTRNSDCNSESPTANARRQDGARPQDDTDLGTIGPAAVIEVEWAGPSIEYVLAAVSQDTGAK